VSGGLTADDAQTPCPGPGAPCVEITPARHASIGDLEVDRALPSRARRTVGAWCFADHMLPTRSGLGIGPHPHIGLHTVTWLVEGEVLHKDSLGSEQPIRPGQLNLMTAGNGIAHAEEDAGSGGVTHGAQLWVAQPDATRHGAPAFEHHAELPRVDLAPGTGTVLVGSHGGATSPARADTPLVGLDLDLPDGAAPVLGLDPAFEHALVVLTGALEVDGRTVEPGHLAYLGLGRDELRTTARGHVRVLLLGGEPFEAVPLMWWNYVGRTAEEIQQAHDDWEADTGRFAPIDSVLPRIPSIAPIGLARRANRG